MTKPSGFLRMSNMGSVTHNAESERIARNIMVILSRTGDTFRRLEWDEYKAERMKDGGFTERERIYFDKVIDYCKSADTAALFAPGWKEATR